MHSEQDNFSVKIILISFLLQNEGKYGAVYNKLSLNIARK